MAAGDSLEKDKARWDGKTVEEKPRIKGVYTNKKPMRFVSLHHHTTFSYQDGYGMPEAHVRRTGELNASALAVTEHGNVSSHVKLEKAAEDTGIKPIYGCELYTGDVREGTRTQRKNHLTVLASDDEGYRNLLRVVSQGWSDFYYEPTVSGSVLAEHRSGLFVLSGCTGSLLATSLVGGKNVDPADASYERGKQVAARFKRAFGDRYYLEVQAFPELEVTRTLNPMLAQISQELKIPLVATGDVHYTRPNESEMQMILHNVRGGNKQTLEEQARAWGYDVPLAPPLTDARLLQRLVGTGLDRQAAISAILASEEIAQACNVKLPKLPALRFPTPPGYKNNLEVWKAWLKEGWRYRGCHLLPHAEAERYREQLRREMEVIEGKEFYDYLLIVSDIVKFAKNADIAVGPARGSAAASIACWLLRITEVNPMIFPGLVFERFIDPTRADPPDVDLDFDSERRSEIRDYCVAKYGADCVANIGTFTAYKSKNSLDDIARVYKIPQYAADLVKDVLIERSSGDLRASATIEDTIDMFDQARDIVEKFPNLMKATKLEGNVKGMGVHSAGIVIANGPITDICAIYEREVKGELTQVISLDKYDAERQNLVKIDVLGLSTMTMIKEAMRIVGMTVEDLYAIPLDDEEVIRGFKENDVVGIFQFDGRAMRSVNAELQPDNFKEVCDVNALARPGPLHNNASASYIDIKKGRVEPQRLHPIYDAIAQETNFQVVYQEQILRIVREIGGFDWTKAAHIRKIISKKLGEQEFQRQWELFFTGAQERGLDEETARKIWGLCITSGSYAFNAAHCVSYGMLAWWTMWFKRHHPVAFYTASLRKMPDKKQLEYLRDAVRHGINVLPPDPQFSEWSWSYNDKGELVGGFAQIHGIGEKTAKKIIEYREEHGIGEWDELINISGIGGKTIEKIREFCKDDDPYGIHALKRRLDAVRSFVRSRGGLPRPTHTSLQIPYSRGENVDVTWVGVILKKNLRDLFESNFARTGEQLDPADVTDPHLREWVIMVGADEDELVTVTVDRWRYPEFKNAIWAIKPDHDVVLIKGVKKGYQARRAVYVKRMWVIDPDDDSEEEVEW